MLEADTRAEPIAELTARQAEVFNFMVRFTVERFYQPSIREIGRGVGIKSHNGVHCHLKALHRKGLIDMEPAREGRRFAQARAIQFNRRTPIEHTPAPEPSR